MKKSVTNDWTLRESARAKINVMVKSIPNKHGYPPDLQEEAIKTVPAHVELRARSGFEAQTNDTSHPQSRLQKGRGPGILGLGDFFRRALGDDPAAD
jgi:hypothetical protein